MGMGGWVGLGPEEAREGLWQVHEWRIFRTPSYHVKEDLLHRAHLATRARKRIQSLIPSTRVPWHYSMTCSVRTSSAHPTGPHRWLITLHCILHLESLESLGSRHTSTLAPRGKQRATCSRRPTSDVKPKLYYPSRMSECAAARAGSNTAGQRKKSGICE